MLDARRSCRSERLRGGEALRAQLTDDLEDRRGWGSQRRRSQITSRGVGGAPQNLRKILRSLAQTLVEILISMGESSSYLLLLLCLCMCY